jgi:diguanylate cyclase (GGDEF)-like protein
VATVITAAIFLHVYFSHRTSVARWGLAMLSIVVMSITVYIKGAEQLYWIYPALTTVFFLLSPKIAAAIAVSFLTLVTALTAFELTFTEILKFLISAGATLLFCYAFSSKMRRQQHYLEQLATSDPLTHAGNRRAMEENLLRTIESIKRYPNQSSSIILLDIDHFKSINDRFGHSCGDLILKQFADLVRARIRITDRLYRYGGEEFVVVLENTELKEANILANQLRIAIADARWPESDLIVTISAGTAQFNGKESAYEWIERADSALYDAKQQGRNRCLAA